MFVSLVFATVLILCTLWFIDTFLGLDKLFYQVTIMYADFGCPYSADGRWDKLCGIQRQLDFRPFLVIVCSALVVSYVLSCIIVNLPPKTKQK